MVIERMHQNSGIIDTWSVRSNCKCCIRYSY